MNIPIANATIQNDSYASTKEKLKDEHSVNNIYIRLSI